MAQPQALPAIGGPLLALVVALVVLETVPVGPGQTVLPGEPLRLGLLGLPLRDSQSWV